MRRALALLLLLASTAPAATIFRRAHRRTGGFTLRRRLFTSPLITNPGGVDLEFSGVFDPQNGSTLPLAIKWTPTNWRTELSAGFDTVANLSGESPVGPQFSDHLNLAATTAFHYGEHVDWAVAPVASLSIRGEAGSRVGGLLAGRYDRASHTLSGAVSWSGATPVNPDNPAGLFDLTTGYAKAFGKWTPYANVQFERATGAGRQFSVFEGVEWQIRPRFAIDIGGQHYGVNTGQIENHFSVGLTVSLR